MSKINKYNQVGLLATTTNTTITLTKGLLNRLGMTENIVQIKNENPFHLMSEENKFEFALAPTPKWYENPLIDYTLFPDNKVNYDLFRKPKNNFVYFSDNAIKESKTIKLNKSMKRFSFDDIKNIPNNTMETFLLGSRFYRYWIIDGVMYVMHFQQWRSVEQFNLDTKFEKSVFNEFAEKVGGVDELKKYINGEMVDKQYNDLVEKIGKQKADIQKIGYQLAGGRQILDNTLIFSLDLNNQDIEYRGRGYEILIQFIQLLVFLRFGDVNVKIVKSNSASKVKGLTFTNESSKNITIVTANWNTLSINTDGFSVSGHIRFQPCGKGRKDIKKIHIKPYEKKGYIKKGNGLKNVNVSEFKNVA